MLELQTAIYAVLENDSQVASRVVDVYSRRNPDSPETLQKPLVVVRVSDQPDRRGYHKAVVDVVFEVKIWGYGYAMQEACFELADVIDSVLLEKKLTDVNGDEFVTGLRSEGGWQDIGNPNPDVIHLQNRYAGRAWPAWRINQLAT